MNRRREKDKEIWISSPFFANIISTEAKETNKMTGRRRDYKWEMLALLFCACFFYFSDRALFGIVKSSIQHDLKLNDDQLGTIDSVMFFALALCMPLAGIVGDRFSRKWVITCSLIFWSCTTALTGFAGGMMGLILVRSVATAGSESFYSPPAMALIASYHRETRALAMSIHQAALYIGMMSTGYLAGAMNDAWGWRTTFYFFGALGLVLGAVFIARLKDSPREPSAQSGAPKTSTSPLQALGILFRVPTACLLLTGFTAIVFVNNAYVSWATRLLQDRFHLTTKLAGGYAMFFHHAAALVAILAGGYVSDRLAPRLPRARLVMMTCAMLAGMLPILMLGMAPTLAGVVLAMAAFGFCRGLYECNTHASLFEVIEPRHRGSAVAVMIMVAFIIGSWSPKILGKMSTHWGPARGLSLGFSWLSLAYLVGGLAVAAAALWTYQRDRIVEPGLPLGSGLIRENSCVKEGARP